MRRALLLTVAATVACAAATARGQDPAPPAAPSTRAVGTGRFAALSNALALYSPFESPWATLRANHALELRLFALMRAEVRLWDLQEALGAPDGPAYEDAAEVARIIHAQVLAEATDALPSLQKTPNKPLFAQLLVRQLEAYPYEWKEEGSEALLPALHKLTDPSVGNPPVPDNRRRRRRRPARPHSAETPTASPAAQP